ncbi:NADH-quinone oxidoreductase subunit L [Parachlamydia sp. AcF125]|uniref:NADH-quinone oxidoreductase subunit L n=1 Tax=Parachlamydia sp. AcF125 TaxID=2795736 RepID=UPI001BC9D221|nr:NADH-quinone oxidoreductase subunit L [Parachlamydia sp. AcF125]MBS4167686.1 NADH-quinone oxidoreductase subunit 12 [Parachlamydia sp. AcF125]
MPYAILIGLFLPLVGFFVLMCSSGCVGRRLAGIIACTTLFISFFCFSSAVYHYVQTDLQPFNIELYRWISIEKVQADFSLHIDSISLLMTLIITGIGFLIHLYSIGYMEHDHDYARYFACLNLFVFAMLLLVLSANLLLLFMGWEGVGVASYLLIGFWYESPPAAAAAKKAFVVNRIGDLGLLLGLLLTFYLFGTSDVTAISNRVSQGFLVGAPLLSVLTLLYFVGAIGKSAQLPLHVWLPDAMEGPTPVSALIHAATMVTAGVYLVVRLRHVFLATPDTLHLVGYVGATTALFAALCALAQHDLKRVLAYSTVSQLGYMFLACGTGAFYAALFHLTTHAFVKALLFLSAGNVVHRMQGSTDMRKMGGLYKVLPKTDLFFLIGVLALSGIPPLSAFFSKDLILEKGYLSGFKKLFYVGWLTSLLTAFYLTRAYVLAFRGKMSVEAKALKTIKEAPAVMIWPVALLALLSIFGGFLGFGVGEPALLEHFLAGHDPSMEEEVLHTNLFRSFETWLSIIGGILSVGAAVFAYTRYSEQLKKTLPLFNKAFYVDTLYERSLVRPLKVLAQSTTRFFEPLVFGGSIKILSGGVQRGAGYLQKIQSGQIRSYVAWMVIGIVILVFYLGF